MRTTSLALALTAGAGFTRDISIAWIGVPLNVAFACGLGTAASFSIADKIEPRGKMWKIAFGSYVMGMTLTGLVTWVVGAYTDKEIADGAQAGIGAAVSFATTFFLPWFADVISKGKWVSWVPFLKKGNGE